MLAAPQGQAERALVPRASHLTASLSQTSPDFRKKGVAVRSRDPGGVGGVAAGGSSGALRPTGRTMPSAAGTKLGVRLTLRWGPPAWGPSALLGLGAELFYMCMDLMG